MAFYSRVLGDRPSSRGVETCESDRSNAFKGCPSGQRVRPRPIWVGFGAEPPSSSVEPIGSFSRCHRLQAKGKFLAGNAAITFVRVSTPTDTLH